MAQTQGRLTTPTPRAVHVDGAPFSLVAFYYPGKPTAWDLMYHATCFGNFWQSPVTITPPAPPSTIDGESAPPPSGTFATAEAAFECTKWWTHEHVGVFEACADGDAAVAAKRRLEKYLHDDRFPDSSHAGFGWKGAMAAVLASKFSDPALAAALAATGDAYLLRHDSDKGRDSRWSDDHDGSGANELGKALMELRAALAGKSMADYPDYPDVASFTARVVSSSRA